MPAATSTEGPRVWEAVLAHIEKQLRTGELSLGGRLPSERALAAELNVGRSSVREAIRALEILGLIRTQTGSGLSAGATLIDSSEQGMTALLRLQLAAQNFAVEDILHTRLLLETEVMRTLAGRRSPDVDATALLDRMDDPGLSREEFLHLDAALHLHFARAAGNSVIAATMAGLRSAIEGYVIAGSRRLPSWDATVARLRTEHRAIVAAVDSGDGELAARLVHDHIVGYYAETGLRSTTPRHP